MAQQVSILDGEVNRNWHLVDSGGEKHLLTLFHDCMTGARAAMLDYEAKEEVPGSAGTTNLFNLVAGRVDIPFSMKKKSPTAEDNGRLSILRRGLTGFSYECEVNGKLVLDTTSVVQNTEYEYEVSVPATVDTGSRVRGVTWYEVHTMRKADSKGTLVHRRFRDFHALQEQVESLMKGHHLRSSLPRFPGKKSKLWTNHGDLSFVEERRKALEQYLKTLLQLPHVSTLDSTRAFLGMVGNLREFSVSWEGKELGAKLKRASEVAGGKLGVGGAGSAGPNGDGGAPPVITSVLGNGRSPPGVCSGDRLFKVNGDSTELMSLEAAWSSVARATRPVMLHFLGPILRMDSTLAPLPEAFLRHRTPPGRQLPSTGPQDGGPSLAGSFLRPSGSGGASAAGPAGAAGGVGGGQWRLRGMLPAWSREQPSKPGDGSALAPGGSAAPGREWNPHENPRTRIGNGVGRGGAVGPFGNGTGAAAAGRTNPANSSLFGGDATAGASGGGMGGAAKKESLFDSWRSPRAAAAGAGAGMGGTLRQAPGSSFGGGGSSRRSSAWMPDTSRGSGTSTSSSPPGNMLGAAGAVPTPPTSREELAGSGSTSNGNSVRGPTDRPARGGLFSAAGSGGENAGFPGSSGGSSMAASPAWPSEQSNAPLGGAAGAEGRVRGGESSGGRNLAVPTFSSSLDTGARFTSEVGRSGGTFVGTTTLGESDDHHGFEEEDGEEEENPFA
ncbi:unnamed protein product [Ectocarpus sp. CCAP 1310/34]|nr:unnamed protein product [Ectocarpus sp. CCAP 1310/34]